MSLPPASSRRAGNTEDAADGAFARQAARPARDGPREPHPASALEPATPGSACVGDDLIDALLKEWDEDRQSPKQISSGDPRFVLANPLYRARVPEQVVEHLLWGGARAGPEGEAGYGFTGTQASHLLRSWGGSPRATRGSALAHGPCRVRQARRPPDRVARQPEGRGADPRAGPPPPGSIRSQGLSPLTRRCVLRRSSAAPNCSRRRWASRV